MTLLPACCLGLVALRALCVHSVVAVSHEGHVKSPHSFPVVFVSCQRWRQRQWPRQEGRQPQEPFARSLKPQEATSAPRAISWQSSPWKDGGLADLQQYWQDENVPHERRVATKRRARRVNHNFQHLYRHVPLPPDFSTATTAADYLQSVGGYSPVHVEEMQRSFPPLQNLLHVERQLHPKLLFLQRTLLRLSRKKNETTRLWNDDIRKRVPPHYYGVRLERTLAPRHAFLVWQNLPHGQDLFYPDNKFPDFLLACRQTKQFCAWCNQWATTTTTTTTTTTKVTVDSPSVPMITPSLVDTFELLFHRGLLSLVRNDKTTRNETSTSVLLERNLNMTSGQLVSLLISHGANPQETDVRGVTLLHWAAGSGNLDALRVLRKEWSSSSSSSSLLSESLLHTCSLLCRKTARDGSTPLHWAAAGAGQAEFGTGGHVDICRFLLTEYQSALDGNKNATTTNLHLFPRSVRDYVNLPTKDGNTALMWAAWAGSLDVVKLLVRHVADVTATNRNGCTVAHWAASGGNLQVCQYLARVAQVNFTQPNFGGNTPLCHAVGFGRVAVVEWLVATQKQQQQQDDEQARQLAQSLLEWSLLETTATERKDKSWQNEKGAHEEEEIWNLLQGANR